MIQWSPLTPTGLSSPSGAEHSKSLQRRISHGDDAKAVRSGFYSFNDAKPDPDMELREVVGRGLRLASLSPSLHSETKAIPKHWATSPY